MKVMILLKFPLYGGGSGTYTRKLAELLAKEKGYKVAVVTPDTREIKGCTLYTIKPAFKAVFEAHPEMKRAKKYSKLSGMEFSRQYLAYMRDITAAVADFKPDVIHVNHASFLTWIASFIRSMFGITFVTTIHGTDVYNATIDPRYRVLTKQALERSESMIAVSPHTKKWFVKVFGKKLLKKTRVIANSIIIDEFKKMPSVAKIEKEYNLKGKKVVLFAGRLTWEKGVEYLIRAAKTIKGEIYIAGGGPHEKALKNLAKLIGVKNVHFLGYIGKDKSDYLKAFYHRSNVLVLPSVVDESTGLVLLEAMAYKTPVVASDKGGIPIVVKNGYNGFLVRARSSKAITQAVNNILTDEILEKRLGENARLTIENKFSWQVILSQFTNIYGKAAEVTNKLQKQKYRALFDRDDIEREKEELQKKIV
jgi:glycosyltransferase involved in cell wall biosynthesis